MHNKKDMFQMWIACILTAGEWTIALFVLVQHGDIVMIYLAVTYAMRETSGGKHYHEIIIEGIQKLRTKRTGVEQNE